MKLTLMLKLLPSTEQHWALTTTMAAFNAACNNISTVAWATKTFNKVALQKLVYRDTRTTFGLSAQMAIRAIAKVAEAYKVNKTVQATFRPHGAMIYDQRILSWRGLDTASILTTTGRTLVKFVMGGYQRERLAAYGVRGQADLLYRNGTFYLAVVVEFPEPALPTDGSDFLGVDLGIVALATDSDGESYSGTAVERYRRIHAHRRRNLQRKGTRAAKRKLRKLSGRQARYQRNTNHIISKALVRKAQDTGRGIAVENLTGIRKRVTVRRQQRARHSNWGFYQLKTFISYKAALAGVLVQTVDPRNTSRTCQSCGYCSKKNRKSQSKFLCMRCGFAAPADHNAAVNIRQRALLARAAVIQPLVSFPSDNGGEQTQATPL